MPDYPEVIPNQSSLNQSTVQPIPQSPQAMPSQPIYQPPVSKKTPSVLIILLIFVSIVFLAVIGIGLFLILNKDTSSPTSDPKNKNESVIQKSDDTQEVLPNKPSPTNETATSIDTSPTVNDFGSDLLIDLGSLAGQNLTEVTKSLGQTEDTVKDGTTLETRSTYRGSGYFVDFYFDANGAFLKISLYIIDGYDTSDKDKLVKVFNLQAVSENQFTTNFYQDPSSKKYTGFTIQPK